MLLGGGVEVAEECAAAYPRARLATGSTLTFAPPDCGTEAAHGHDTTTTLQHVPASREGRRPLDDTTVRPRCSPAGEGRASRWTERPLENRIVRLIRHSCHGPGKGRIRQIGGDMTERDFPSSGSASRHGGRRRRGRRRRPSSGWPGVSTTYPGGGRGVPSQLAAHAGAGLRARPGLSVLPARSASASGPRDPACALAASPRRPGPCPARGGAARRGCRRRSRGADTRVPHPPPQRPDVAARPPARGMDRVGGDTGSHTWSSSTSTCRCSTAFCTSASARLVPDAKGHHLFCQRSVGTAHELRGIGAHAQSSGRQGDGRERTGARADGACVSETDLTRRDLRVSLARTHRSLGARNVRYPVLTALPSLGIDRKPRARPPSSTPLPAPQAAVVAAFCSDLVVSAR